MKHSRTTQLSPSLTAHLNAYTLAASGVSAGLLALATPADAKVVYTPTHVILNGHHSGYKLDLNNDGKEDFEFSLGSSSRRAVLTVHNKYCPRNCNGMMAEGTWPLALEPGIPIGPKRDFLACSRSASGCYPPMAYSFLGRLAGFWNNVKDRYLGLQFYAGGKVYYGWARLSVKIGGLKVNAVLTGYAYDNTPNHPIHAGQTSGTFDEPVYGADDANPESGNAPPRDKPISQNVQPTTLGVLALGAPGVPLWRREEPASAVR